MKKNTFILIALIFALLHMSFLVDAALHSYASSSVLAEGKFVKIQIKESGVYKLTFEDLKNMGINSPENVRLFGYGGAVLSQNFTHFKWDDLPEVTIHMESGSDGVFNAGDYILFYAQGVNSWSYDQGREMYIHELNHYADKGCYFVTSDAGVGKKIQLSEYNLPSGAAFKEVNEFVDYAVHEEESRSLAKSGKVFYGEIFSETLSLNIDFTFPNIRSDNNAVKTRLDVAATASIPSAFRLNLSGGQTKTVSVSSKSDSDHYEKARGASGIHNFTPDKDLLDFQVIYDKSTSTAKGYLNYLEVNARRSLKMFGSAMRFQYPDLVGSSTYSKFQLSNATSTTQVWDITDPVNMKRVNASLQGDTLIFFASNTSHKVFLAVEPSDAGAFAKPKIAGTVPNQNLHAMPQVDMVIITHPDFLQQAKRLADAHNNQGDVSVEVVTTQQVYNEFSSGVPDATAYRWVMKMLYDRALAMNQPEKKPKYILLFGKGSYDNRNVLPSTGPSYVLTYQAENSLVETLSYVTDDYFTFLEDHEGTQIPSHTMDLGVGRFPVSNVQEATDVVTKNINYMKNDVYGIWKNQVCFLADDGDGALHMKQADSIASMIGRTHPDYQITKIFLDAYQQEVNASGESYPVARAQFHNMLHQGMFVLDYTGHAGATGWTNEQILSTSDVRNLSNKHLPLWIGATCNFLQFDLPTISAGEQVLLNPVGGGIGIISAARPVYASQNMNINKLINYYLFLKENGEHLRVGDVIARAKNDLRTEINKLSYVYMGNPALRLNYPDTYQIVTEKINGVSVQGNDTLRALSVATVEGYVADKSGDKMEWFNGELSAAIYDKIQRITTLNNDKNGALTFSDRPNVLFSGVTKIVDGKFSITFMLPKDIKYNYGTGRINYYAYDEAYGDEAQGAFEDFYIGGSNPDFEYELDGPDIHMYLNRADFVAGDQANEMPLFIAHVTDVNGINQVGSGIGHDIMLIIDNDPGQSYILNEYYQSDLNDFTKGTIRFKLPELSPGKHTLTFRVWDLLNNSSTKSLDFEVVRGLEPVIFNVYNYPNPVKSFTKFVIEHDRPETVLNAKVDIFDVSGRLIWSFKQSTLEEITWDIHDNSGERLKTGIYLYRISVESNTNEVFSKINKLMLVD